ncbi:MAG: SAM-dependent methyltransferase [Aquificaceae bacterium]
MFQRVREYYQGDFRKDFFTAPELDRAFGYALGEFISELIGDFEKPILLELGGGSGALAYDILYYLKQREPELFERASYYIYDFSPTLVELQKIRLEGFEGKVFWCRELFPLEGVVFSNEFFDCLPVHVVKERRELFIRDGEEVWLELEDSRVKEVLKRMDYEGLSQVLEVCVDCVEFLKKLASYLIRGYHLVIDYGYTSEELHRFPEGTVLGYSSHSVQRDVLKSEKPVDITAQVNFSLLEEYGKDSGLEKVFLKRLRDFLLESPAFLREFEELSLSEKPEDLERLSRLKTMLVSMGDRFRVLLQRKLQSP